jgi:hypothetical protein
MISLKYNSLHYNKYLNDCDINYKYCLKSINDIPVLKKVVFELPTNMLPNMEISEEEYRTRLLLKCFLSFYLINYKTPYINCNRFQNSKIVGGTINNFHYTYLATYNNLIEKYTLLSLLFNETDRNNKSYNILTKLNKKININTQASDALNFRVELQASRIIEYKEILSNIFTRIELQNLKFKLNIVFKKFNNKILSVDELKNFFYMWNI